MLSLGATEGSVRMEHRDQQRQAGRQVMAELPAKPQMLHFILKQWRHDRVSFIFYNSSDCYLKTETTTRENF